MVQETHQRLLDNIQNRPIHITARTNNSLEIIDTSRERRKQRVESDLKLNKIELKI